MQTTIIPRLPSDVIGNILLHTKGKPKVFRAWLLVSKRINQLVFEILPQWISENRNSFSKIPFALQSRLNERLGEKLTFLETDSDLFEVTLGDQFSNLTRLSLLSVSSAPRLAPIKNLPLLKSLKCNLFNQNNLHVDETFPTGLTHLEIKHPPSLFLNAVFLKNTHLKSLTLRYGDIVSGLPADLECLTLEFNLLLTTQRFQFLTVLDIYNSLLSLESFPSLKQLTWKNYDLLPLAFPTSLRVLKVTISKYSREHYEELLKLSHLQKLNLKIGRVTNAPDCSQFIIGTLKENLIPSNVTELKIRTANFFPVFPNTIQKLALSDVNSKKGIPSILDLSHCELLKDVKIKYCNLTSLKPSPQLKKLYIEWCDRLENLTLPALLDKIELIDCQNLKSLSLQTLHLRSVKIQQLDSMETLGPFPSTLQKLRIRSCRSLNALGTLTQTHMIKLVISHNPKLLTIPELPETIQYLSILENLGKWNGRWPRDLHTISQDTITYKMTIPNKLYRIMYGSGWFRSNKKNS